MKSYRKELWFNTPTRVAFLNITGEVRDCLRASGVREGLVLGVRGADGRVICPPVEYDPVTSDELTELVELPARGTVTTWSWEPEPRPGQPLDHPFAWALVRMDGADTGLLHAVDAGSADAMRTGMTVRVRWRDEREGAITDIACFEPVEEEG